MALPTAPAFTALIPARYASSRLPGKPLADIAGKPMVVRVAERARAAGAARVAVATDDERVRAAVAAHGIAVCMTRSDHPTGTDRLAEAAAQLGLADDAIVVNVQGDEPLLEPALIRAMAQTLCERTDAAIATACHPIADVAEAFSPNVVKVVLDARGDAMYFSRATDSLGARRLRAVARAHPVRTPDLPALRALRLPRRFPARLPRAHAGAASRVSRRWSSCARSGTATGSRWRSPRERRRPGSTRPRTSSGSARSTPGRRREPVAGTAAPRSAAA